MKLFLVLFLALFFSSGLFDSVLAESSNVFISEFAAITAGTKEYPDWIEIYNTSNETISIEGWHIKDSTDSNKITLSGCIKPKSFRKFDFSNKLNNSGDQIRLINANSNLVESVNYFSEIVPKHEINQSTLKDLSSGNWESNLSPTPTNTACSQSLPGVSTLSVSLSEIYPNPEKDEQEWVEIYNPNNSTVVLDSWYFVDSANHKKPLIGSVGAKKYKAFYFTSGWLNNTGDTVSLFNPSRKLVEKYSYPKGSNNSSFARNNAGKWLSTITPTPNGENKITGSSSNALSATKNSATDNSPDIVSTTGLDTTVDYLSGSFQFEQPTTSEPSKDLGEVAGISKGSNRSSISTILISAGLAFIATAIAWPFLEKYKIV